MILTDDEMPPLPNLDVPGSLWDQIIAWHEADFGKKACDAADAVDMAITTMLLTYARQVEAAVLKKLAPVAWLYKCSKPGLQTVYASVDENDTNHWPVDQWASIEKTPLAAIPQAEPTSAPLPPTAS
jgi:hypothetical protein